MRRLKFAAILLLISMILSCRSYTIKDGRERISIPSEGEKIETRFNVLEAERRAEEERIAREKAEKEAQIAAKKAEEERIAFEIAEKARLEEERRLEAERKAEEERLEKERIEEERRLEAERKAEEERIERERIEEERRLEAERKAEEERIERERIEEELRILNAINYYPEDISMLEVPHVFRPVKENLMKDDAITRLTLMFIPLGERTLSEESIASIISSISDMEADFIGLSGSIENQVLFASTLSKDAVTFEDGTVIYRSTLVEKDKDSAIFKISEKKTISISVCDQEPELPESQELAYELLSLIPDNEEALVGQVAEASECNEEKRVLFLSSAMPATSDWNTFTDYSYRYDMQFPISDYLASEGWIDAFDASRFSVETDAGITRRNGEIFERMDFIHLKSLILLDAMTIPAAGLTDTVNAFITIAEVLVP